MRFLIDGYNLMHAAGYLTSQATGRLEPIRKRFLDWLAGIVKTRDSSIAVVFDGRSSRGSQSANHLGVRVFYSSGETADDTIESFLIAPRSNDIVVSNDSRLHEAARRARKIAWSCDRFLDWVIAPETTPARSVQPIDKPLPAGIEAELLTAFRQPRERR